MCRCHPALPQPACSLGTLGLASKLEWQTEAGGYCRETDGTSLDELAMLAALKQKQQTSEMIQNWGWRSQTACVPNSPSTNQPHTPGEVAQWLAYEMAGGVEHCHTGSETGLGKEIGVVC